MIISAIVAVDNKNGIGKDNNLPWHLPKDLKFFKETTSGHAVIMGRKTFESLGKPLKNRDNYVITTQPDYTSGGIIVCGSMGQALDLARAAGETECFILGGGQIFSRYLAVCDRLYLTRVDVETEADVFFPLFNLSEWEEKWREDHVKDEKHAFDFSFFRYDRKN